MHCILGAERAFVVWPGLARAEVACTPSMLRPLAAHSPVLLPGARGTHSARVPPSASHRRGVRLLILLALVGRLKVENFSSDLHQLPLLWASSICLPPGFAAPIGPAGRLESKRVGFRGDFRWMWVIWERMETPLRGAEEEVWALLLVSGACTPGCVA